MIDWQTIADDLYQRIKHGDPEHQRWLRARLDEWAEAMRRKEMK